MTLDFVNLEGVSRGGDLKWGFCIKTLAANLHACFNDYCNIMKTQLPSGCLLSSTLQWRRASECTIVNPMNSISLKFSNLIVCHILASINFIDGAWYSTYTTTLKYFDCLLFHLSRTQNYQQYLCKNLSLIITANHIFRSQPEPEPLSMIAEKLEEPVSNFVDKLIKFGEEKVNMALGSVNTPQPPDSERYIAIPSISSIHRALI